METAERIFGEVPPENEVHRAEVVRDLETLGRVRGSDTAVRIAAELAGAEPANSNDKGPVSRALSTP